MNRRFCNRILEALHASGIEDLVVSPGSRSTPLLLAALESPLRLHSVIDERSAAFFALGRARAENKKVALLCTSGSAGAHYLPALLEARYARHGLVAITADRPGELHESGANQTIVQDNLFAAACPPALMLEANDEHALAARRRVQQAIVMASGPVHINIAFRKPFEPRPGQESRFGDAPKPSALWPAQSAISDAALEYIAARCAEAKRGVIVAGPCAPELGSAILALAEATGFVLLAESTSGARMRGHPHALRCDGFVHLLDQAQLADTLRPELVVQIGQEPSCGPLLRWLEPLGSKTLRLPGASPANTPKGSCELILGSLEEGLCRLIPLMQHSGDPAYAQDWAREDKRVWHALARRLATESATELGEAVAIAEALASLPALCQLMVGNSLSIRNLDAVLSGERASLRISHQRGTSGIDGLIAGAIGASGTMPSALLLGDVSAAHDLSSLSLAALARGPLQIFMIDNAGGQIFTQLPVAQLDLKPEQFQRWLTTPRIDFAAACSAHAVPYRCVQTRGELAAGLRWSREQDGVSFLHLRVQPDSMARFNQGLREELA